MREIILYDKYTSGHHLSYLRIYATAFAELGCRVKILTSEVENVEAAVSGVQGFGSGDLIVKHVVARKVTEIERERAYQRGAVKDYVNSYGDIIEALSTGQYYINSKTCLIRPNGTFDPSKLIYKYLPAVALFHQNTYENLRGIYNKTIKITPPKWLVKAIK